VIEKLKNKMSKKKARKPFARPGISDGEKKFYAKLCMHVKITSVRSYKKQWYAETQTHKQILMIHTLVKLIFWMIEISCVIIDKQMISCM